VILPVFKTGARHLRDVLGVFDSHTLPPIFPPSTILTHGTFVEGPDSSGFHTAFIVPLYSS